MSDTFSLGFPEAARRLGVPIRVLRRAIRAGKIPAPPRVTATASLDASWFEEVQAAVAASPKALSRSLPERRPRSRDTRGRRPGASILIGCVSMLGFVVRRPGVTVVRQSRTLDRLASVIPGVCAHFSDRPEGIASNMPTASFIPFWSYGKNSFLSDPPNADISIVEGSKLHQAVVVLRDPVLDGHALSYTVKLVGRTVPATKRERVGIHRHHWNADHAAVLCGRSAARIPPSDHV